VTFINEVHAMSRLPIVFALTASIAVAGPSLCAQLAGTTGQPVRSQTQSSPKVTRVGETATGQDLGISRGSQLIGRQVFDPSGTAIGAIKDLVIDHSGHVTAVLSREGGGFTGVPLSSLTPQLAAAPATAQTGAAQRADTSMGVSTGAQTANVDRFVFSGDVTRLRSAPVLQDPSRIDETWTRATAEHFGVGTTGAATAQPGPAAAGRVATATGQQVRPALGFQNLMSRRLNAASGQPVGEFRDVAIDLRTGQAPFVIFGRPGTGATTGEVLHGAGFDAFTFNDPSTALMDIDPGTLDRSPGIDMARLPSEPSFRLEGRAPHDTTPAGKSARPGTGESGTKPATPRTAPRTGGSRPR
jgi:sporulation protein YlmC with PRC-barrel domain